MSKKNTKLPKPTPIEDEGVVVEITDDRGNIYRYNEEVILMVGEQRYAVLVSIPEEDHDDDDPEVILAKIVIDEHGEDLYIEPTEEEFELARDAYDRLFDEDEMEQ